MRISLLLLIIGYLSSTPMQAISVASINILENENKIARNFLNPPDSAKPQTWWHWMNGNVTKDGITADLEAMKRVGIGGFQVFHIRSLPEGSPPKGPVGYMSNDWLDMMKYTIMEADRLGLDVGMHNCAGWSSSGGPWITPEYSMKKVVWTEKQVDGPNDFSGQLEKPETIQNYYRDIAVLAFPTPKSELSDKGFHLLGWKIKAGYEPKGSMKPDQRKISDQDIIKKEKIIFLTDSMNNEGRLQWSVPAGQWTIVRFGYTSTGSKNQPAPEEGEGLECDKFSKEAAGLHWENSVQRVIDKVGPLTGKTFHNILIDSYEAWYQNWSDRFSEEFHRRMNYDLTSYMPALTGRIVESIEITERFLWDFRYVVSDLFAENYFGYFAEMCHRNGMVLSIEPYGSRGNFNNFQVSSKADIAMSEFWIKDDQVWENSTSKLAASAAHTYGRKYVGAEAFTASAKSCFINHPYVLKSEGDYYYCQGINRFLFHTYVHQPWQNVYPGMTMGPYGFQFNRNNTWFEKSSAWLKYLARCQYMLQEGQFTADICYFTGEQSPWAQKRESVRPSIPMGYDYDFCTTEILFKMSVKNGLITLPSGMQYRMLVLPDEPLRPLILQKIKNLVKSGAKVYGFKPTTSPSLKNYPACDDQVNELANELWGNGKIICEKPLDEVMKSMKILPDFEFSGAINELPSQYHGSGIEYIHRRINEADVYFVSNQQQQTTSINAIFRISDKLPELWHPDTGKIEDTPLYSFSDDERTIVPLTLDPAGSVFVVFRKPCNTKRIHSIAFKAAKSNDDASKTHELKIKKAIYELWTRRYYQMTDVTENISNMVQADQLTVEVNEIVGAAAPDVCKNLKVYYLLDGKFFSKTVTEGQVLVLPEPETKEEVDFKVSYKNDKITLAASKIGQYSIQKADSTKEIININKISKPVNLDGSWELFFPKGWGAPEKINLEKLIDWTEHKDFDISHFSGTATYSKKFELLDKQLSADESIYLDLGAVYVIAEVKLNGKNLGILWKPPYKVEVSNIIKVGTNILEVGVTNLWVNRLIGDEKYPDDYLRKENEYRKGIYAVGLPEWLIHGEKRSNMNRKTFITWLYNKREHPLLPSGLIGPVQLVFEKNITLE